METGNIDHEQIKIKDAKEACIKIGAVIGRNSCNWSLDVNIDGVVYTDLEICYHCQLEKEFTPEKAFDLFDYGVSVFVLCNPKEDKSIERKVIGLVPLDNDPYPKLCGLKRFFAKVQQVDSNGYPLWEDQIDPFIQPDPICKYYWIFFDEDGSVRAEEVKNHSFIDPDDALMALMEEESSLLKQYNDGAISLEGLAKTISDFADQHANATEILDKVTTIPDGSNSVFTKAFMLDVGECSQRYVAEQHLLLKDRQIKYDYGADYPISNCGAVHETPYPCSRFYCNIALRDMVWYSAAQDPCVVFLGITLHINEDGSIGESHPFDFWGYINYLNTSGASEGYYDVPGSNEMANNDHPYDIIPDLISINGTVIEAFQVYLGRPIRATYDVASCISSCHDVVDASHLRFTEKGFESVPSWNLDENENNPITLGDHNINNVDNIPGVIDLWEGWDWNSYDYYWELCNNCNSLGAGPGDECCSAKCRHCASYQTEVHKQWTQDENGKSTVTFWMDKLSGHVENYWDAISAVSELRQAKFRICTDLGNPNCTAGGDYSASFGGGRYGDRNYKTILSESFNGFWVNPNVAYCSKTISRKYDIRSLHWNAGHEWAGSPDHWGNWHNGGLAPDDFDRWTDLSGDCLKCVADVPDFIGPMDDEEGWPPWQGEPSEDTGYVDDPGASTYYYWWNKSNNVQEYHEAEQHKFLIDGNIVFDVSIYETPYYLDDRSTNPSAGLVVAAKGYQDYSNTAGSSHWKIYHDDIDVTDKVLDALKCDSALLVTLGMV